VQKPKANKPVVTETKSHKFILWGILLLTAIVYSNSIGNGFVLWDDDVYIYYNPLIRDLSLQGIKKIFISNYTDNYTPLTYFTNAIEYKFFGLNPKAYHFFNLVFHLLNVWLVFQLISFLIKTQSASNNYSLITHRSSLVPAFVALFFAIHPMHVESVAWATERKDVLYSFFFLLSLIYYIKEGNKNYLLSILFFLLSCLSKLMAVTLPLVLILIDYYKNKFQISNFKSLIKYIPFITISIILGITAMYTSNRDSGVGIDAIPDFSFLDRIFLASYAVLFYIFKLFVPINLSAIYPFPIKENGIFPIEYYVAPIIILLIFWGIFKLKNYRKEVAFGMLFFLITISIVLQFIPNGKGVVAERYTYIPYIGFFFCFAHTLSKIEGKIKSYLTIILIGYAIIFSILTYQRNKVWKDTLTLFSDVIEKNPTIALAYNQRGFARQLEQDYAGAMQDYSQAISINPNYTEAYINRGTVKHLQQDYHGAIVDYTEVIRIKPTDVDAYFNRANDRANINDMKGACEDWRMAAELGDAQATMMVQQNCN